MKNSVKKVLCCVLTVVMLLSTAPFAVAGTLNDSESQSVYEHEDNGKGYCLYCGKDIDPVSHCDHICHKSGTQSMIYKFIRIFWKIFRVNQYCDCGAVHYGTGKPIDIGSCIPRAEIPSNVSDVVNEFNDIMNNVIPCGTYTLRRVTNDKITVDESLQNSQIVSTTINAFLKPTDDCYYVVDGVTNNGISVGDIISHADSECTLIAQGVSSVSVTETLDGYKTTIKLIGERYYYNNNTLYERPVHHESCLSVPDYGYMDLGFKTEKADINYFGATIEYTVDSLGRVTSLKITNPFHMDMTVIMLSIPAAAVGDGVFAEEYYFIYD